MRAVMIEPDPHWLAERRRLGLDGLDEVWDGVLHVVPQPSTPHQLIESHLERALVPIAHAVQLEVVHQLAIYDPVAGDKNYRVPDILVVDLARTSQRGVEGRAEVVIEILSPNDESRDKLPFYARCEVPEVWLVHPVTRVVEVYVLRGDSYFAVAPNREGAIDAPRLGIELRTIDGPKLRLAWSGGTAEV